MSTLSPVTLEELALHSSESSCWVAVNGLVYDLTAFVESHPGGAAPILRFAGTDASLSEDMQHLFQVINKYEVSHGTVKEVGKLEGVEEDKDSHPSARRIARRPSQKQMSAIMQGVSKHNSEDDCWIVADGVVYDVTDFLKDHPGGAAAIMGFAGKDASEDFAMKKLFGVIKRHGMDQGTVKEIGHFQASEEDPTKRVIKRTASPEPSTPATAVTLEEVTRHGKISDCWTVFDGIVYDVTDFLRDHPAMAKSLMGVAGKNASEDEEVRKLFKVIQKYGIDHGAVREVGRLRESDLEAAPGRRQTVKRRLSSKAMSAIFDGIKGHNSVNDCWTVIGGVVYDMTKFLMDHPGGMEGIVSAVAGKDASENASVRRFFEAIKRHGIDHGTIREVGRI